MQLQYRSRAAGRDRTGNHILDGLRLVAAGGNQYNRTGLHNGANPHGQRLSRYLIGASKEAGVGFDGAGGQLHYLRGRSKAVRRFIEGNMSVAADP